LELALRLSLLFSDLCSADWAVEEIGECAVSSHSEERSAGFLSGFDIGPCKVGLASFHPASISFPEMDGRIHSVWAAIP